jgi:hypothetical protein
VVKYPVVKYPLVKFPVMKYPLVNTAAPSVKIRLHTENQLPKLSGSALKD